MSGKHTLKAALPLVANNKSSAGRWRLVGPAWTFAAESVTEIIESPALLPDDAYYKKELRRCIFHPPAFDGYPEIVVKSFPLKTWKHKIRHRQYAYNEALNLITAKQRGLPVPEVFGFGFSFRKCILRWVAVMMEYVPFPCMRDNFIRGMSESETLENLRRAIPSFRKLYLAGCNHIDFGPHSIMLSPEGAEKDVLIDFQYAGFFDAPNENVLAAQLGYFGWAVGTNRNWVRPSMLDQWYSEVLSALGISFSKKIQEIIRENEARRRPSKKRLEGYRD